MLICYMDSENLTLLNVIKGLFWALLYSESFKKQLNLSSSYYSGL